MREKKKAVWTLLQMYINIWWSHLAKDGKQKASKDPFIVLFSSVTVWASKGMQLQKRCIWFLHNSWHFTCATSLLILFFYNYTADATEVHCCSSKRADWWGWCMFWCVENFNLVLCCWRADRITGCQVTICNSVLRTSRAADEVKYFTVMPCLMQASDSYFIWPIITPALPFIHSFCLKFILPLTLHPSLSAVSHPPRPFPFLSISCFFLFLLSFSSVLPPPFFCVFQPLHQICHL